METDSGDLYCLNWDSTTSTVYFGCQNTSIQWFSFASISSETPPSFYRGTIGKRDTRASSLERVLAETGLHSGTATPRRAHKFFDSYPQYERKPADLNARNPSCFTPPSESPQPGYITPASVHSGYDSCITGSEISSNQQTQILSVPAENMIWSAHYGYVYCMALTPSNNREGSEDSAPVPGSHTQLVTGSGDATVKVGSSYI
jgi:di- and tripeptidase